MLIIMSNLKNYSLSISKKIKKKTSSNSFCPNSKLLWQIALVFLVSRNIAINIFFKVFLKK